MIIRTPIYYKDFACIAGDCPDSCCQGWEVDADEQSLLYYKTINGEIRQRIDSVLDKDEYGNTIFRLSENKRCPFLNTENLCDIHMSDGGEHTPYTCRTFPRFIHDYGSLREIGLSLSCPVACDTIWGLENKFAFVEEQNDLLPTLNDIDASLYFKLLNARKKAFSIMQDESVEQKVRLENLLDFGCALQDEIGAYEEGQDETSFFDVFLNPEVINQQWVDKVKSGQERNVPNARFVENITCYFLSRYFLNAVFDRDVLSAVKMAVVGVLLTTYFGEDSWTAHLWSKETEHSDVNMERYRRLLRESKCLSVSELKKKI